MLRTHMAWTTLCCLEDLKEGCGKYVERGNLQLAVFLHEGRPYVMDNYCPHAGGNLAGGVIHEGCAVCPWHEWAFRLDNGQLRDAPSVKVQTYQTRLQKNENGSTDVEADLPLR